MDIIEIILYVVLFVWVSTVHIENCRLQDDVNRMNRIIKRLQAKNGMIADGIDRVGTRRDMI